MFAPVRLGAMEEVTVSTAGLTAEAGAEGAVQMQFVTKRGTNDFHGQVFDQIQERQAQREQLVNNARDMPKAKLKQNEWGSNIGGPIIQNKLFFFANFEQVIAPSQSTQNRTVLTSEAQQGVFRYTATDNSVRTVNVLDIARANGFPGAIDPIDRLAARDDQSDAQPGDPSASATSSAQSFAFQHSVGSEPNVYPTGRVDWKATTTPSRFAACSTCSGAISPATRSSPRWTSSTAGSRPRTTSCRRARTGTFVQICSTRSASDSRATSRSSTRATRSTCTIRRAYAA